MVMVVVVVMERSNEKRRIICIWFEFIFILAKATSMMMSLVLAVGVLRKSAMILNGKIIILRSPSVQRHVTSHHFDRVSHFLAFQHQVSVRGYRKWKLSRLGSGDKLIFMNIIFSNPTGSAHFIKFYLSIFYYWIRNPFMSEKIKFNLFPCFRRSLIIMQINIITSNH